jgi:hypothetical protein
MADISLSTSNSAPSPGDQTWIRSRLVLTPLPPGRPENDPRAPPATVSSFEHELTRAFKQELQTAVKNYPGIHTVKRKARLPPDAPCQPDPYDPFFISPAILRNSTGSPQIDSKLLRLPHEILRIIFEKVRIPYFQVCLALTCKSMAQVASSNKSKLAPWRGYRDKDGLFRLLARPDNLMPRTLRLCRACFRFRPLDIKYWEKQLLCIEFDNMKINWFDIFSWFSPTAAQDTCPWCSVFGYTSYFSEATYIKARDTAPVERNLVMCPHLTRRMNKP